jgi:hypothetical protein
MMEGNTQEAFQEWRRVCQAIQEEMDQLLCAGCPESELEQTQRRKRFEELIRRREVAARDILPPRQLGITDKDDDGFKAAG